MPAERVQALVLKSVDVFETSRILTLFTLEHGKLSALAKGGRRVKGPFQSALDLLSVCDIVLLRRSADSLDLATEAVLVERFRSLRFDLNALFAGYYLAELLNELTAPQDPHPRLFEAARVTLRHLGDAALRSRRVARFELACLREAGYMPRLDACGECDRKIETKSGRDAVSFGLAMGGLLCPRCRPGQPHVAALAGGTLEALQALASPGRAWMAGPWDRSLAFAVRDVINSLVCHRLGKRPKMLRYLES